MLLWHYSALTEITLLRAQTVCDFFAAVTSLLGAVAAAVGYMIHRQLCACKHMPIRKNFCTSGKQVSVFERGTFSSVLLYFFSPLSRLTVQYNTLNPETSTIVSRCWKGQLLYFQKKGIWLRGVPSGCRHCNRNRILSIKHKCAVIIVSILHTTTLLRAVARHHSPSLGVSLINTP